MKNFSEMTPEELDNFAKETGGEIVDPNSEDASSNTDVAPPKDQGSFLGDVGNAIKDRASQVGDTFKRAWNNNQDPASTGLQTVGAAAGLVGDVVGAGFKSAYRNLVPDVAKDKINEAGQAILATSLGQQGLKKAGQGLDAYDAWKKAHPTVAADLESAVNIAALMPIGKGAKLAEEGAVAAKGALSAEGEGAIQSMSKMLAGRKAAKLADYIAPVMDKEEMQAAIDEGRVARNILGRAKIAPSDKTLALSDKLQKIVDTTKPFEVNAARVKREIGYVSKKEILPYLERNNFQVGKDQVREALDVIKGDKPLHFMSESQQGSTYDKIIQTAMDAVDEAAKTKGVTPVEEVAGMSKKNLAKGISKNAIDNPSTTIDAKGLWDARKKFDQLIAERFPKAFDHPDASAMNKAINNVRRGMNDFISERTGDGAFKKYMSHLSDLYDVHDTLSSKAINEIKNKGIQNWIKKNPAKAFLMGLTAEKTIGKPVLNLVTGGGSGG